jgi:hypothetical protein
MPPMPAVNLVNAEIIMQGVAAAAGSNAVNIANVFHFRRIATVVNANKAQMEAAFQAAIALPILAALNVRYTQTFTSVRFLNDPMDQAQLFPRAIAGSIAGDSMASLDTAFVLLRTGFKGRSFRGRKFLSPMSEADTTATSDVFNAAAIARLTTAMNAMFGGFTDASPNTWVLQVYSRLLDEFVVKPVVVSYDVNQVALNKRIGRLKRREVKSVY